MQLPVAEIEARVAGFQSDMQSEGWAGALIAQRLDLYYFSGTTFIQYLIIPAQGSPLALTRQQVPVPPPWQVETTTKSFGLAQVLPELVPPGERLGLELDVLPANQYLRLIETLPSYRLEDISTSIRRRRAVKTDWEMSVFRDTARRDLAVWEAVPELVATAATDLELSARMEALARSQGHQGLLKFRSFNEEIWMNTVLAGTAGACSGPWDTPLSGPGISPAFPQGASGRPIVPGQPILIDYGGTYHGYILDQSRTFARTHLDTELLKIYDKAREIQDAVIKATRPGAVCGDLYKIAAEIAEQTGLAEYFMGPKRVPFIGHGVGLELDEWPVLARGSKATLQAGMVFALEPKFALPEIGAIGLENCWCVTETGTEKLSFASDELIIA